MSIVYYEPWSMFNGLNPAISRLVKPRRGTRPATSEWQPAVDISEEAEQFVLQVDVPGVDPETIQVSTDDGVLKIQGSRAEADESSEVTYSRRERVRGDFQRSFQLPETADVDSIQASHRHGVLKIVIPKQSEVTPRKIEVTH